MSGLINLIKSLFSGIFGFIGGLLGGKKADPALNQKKGKSDFYLEMADSGESAAGAAPSPAPMTVAVETAKTAPKAADPGANGASSSGKGKSSRKEKLAALAKASDGNQATAADSTSVPQPVTATVATKDLEPEERNFATRYLLTSNNGTRRRPGANMSSYLDMARKMKA